MLIVILMLEKLLEHFMKKELQKTIQKEFRLEKVIKETRNKLHAKWKSYNNPCNSWIDENEIVK